MRSRILRPGQFTRSLIKKPLIWAAACGMAGTAVLVAAAPAQAEAVPPSTSVCQYSNSATQPNSSAVKDVTAGSQITISCSAGSFPTSDLLVIIEASGLAAVVSPASSEESEVDLGALQLVSPAADGSLSDTFTVPTTFSASDASAVCPPTQAQINAGLTCDLVVASVNLATLAATPLDEAQLRYQGQGTPNSPTLVTTAVTKRGVTTLTASDAPGACPTPVTATSHCWWGAGVTGAPNPTAFTGIPGLDAWVGGFPAKNDLSVSPAIYCASGATAAACAGLPAGTLVPPALSGTITTRFGRWPVVVDEPNTTPYRGDGVFPELVSGARNVQSVEFAPPFCAKWQPPGNAAAGRRCLSWIW